MLTAWRRLPDYDRERPFGPLVASNGIDWSFGDVRGLAHECVARRLVGKE